MKVCHLVLLHALILQIFLESTFSPPIITAQMCKMVIPSSHASSMFSAGSVFRCTVTLRETLAKWGKRNCQSSEANKVAAAGFEPRTIRSPVQRSNPLGHSAPFLFFIYFSSICLLIHLLLPHSQQVCVLLLLLILLLLLLLLLHTGRALHRYHAWVCGFRSGVTPPELLIILSYCCLEMF